MSTEQPHDPDKPMKTQADYNSLIADLEAIEVRLGHLDENGRLYLSDKNVDRENACCDENDPEFWDRMYRAASMAAGLRVEDYGYGFDLNAELGYDVY